MAVCYAIVAKLRLCKIVPKILTALNTLQGQGDWEVMDMADNLDGGGGFTPKLISLCMVVMCSLPHIMYT